MKAMSIQKIARVLHALVLIALICNLVILYLVPVAVVSMEASGSHGLLAGVAEYLGDIFHPGEDDIVAAGAAASFLAWFWFWQDTASLSLTLFLVVSGICTAVILWQGRRVLQTILRGEPFLWKMPTVCGEPPSVPSPLPWQHWRGSRSICGSSAPWPHFSLTTPSSSRSLPWQGSSAW